MDLGSAEISIGLVWGILKYGQFLERAGGLLEGVRKKELDFRCCSLRIAGLFDGPSPSQGSLAPTATGLERKSLGEHFQSASQGWAIILPLCDP